MKREREVHMHVWEGEQGRECDRRGGGEYCPCNNDLHGTVTHDSIYMYRFDCRSSTRLHLTLPGALNLTLPDSQ